MRKFMIILFLGFALTGCSTDDDVSTVSYEFAEITESDFPEFFEAGRTYNFEITYKLPSTCHIFLGFDGGKADFSSNEFFIYAWTSINSAKTNCNSTNEEDLIFKSSITNFSISPNAGEDEKYIFHLWTGTDGEGNPIFKTVEVPIGVLDES